MSTWLCVALCASKGVLCGGGITSWVRHIMKVNAPGDSPVSLQGVSGDRYLPRDI